MLTRRKLPQQGFLSSSEEKDIDRFRVEGGKRVGKKWRKDGRTAGMCSREERRRKRETCRLHRPFSCFDDIVAFHPWRVFARTAFGVYCCFCLCGFAPSSFSLLPVLFVVLRPHRFPCFRFSCSLLDFLNCISFDFHDVLVRRKCLTDSFSHDSCSKSTTLPSLPNGQRICQFFQRLQTN